MSDAERTQEPGTDIFCGSAIREGVFYKTKYTMAVCDLMPVVYGHTIIIPIRHVLDMDELSEKETADLFSTIKKVKAVILKLYSDRSRSYDLTAQVGEFSGMSVRHLHFHIIPRTKEDEYQHGKNVFAAIEKRKPLPDEEYRKRVGILRKELKWNE